MTKKRHLAAIMFTDISGFSAMMQRDEVYASSVLKRHRTVVESNHKTYGGQVLQYFGDGTLSIFGSAVSAVECAVQMQMDLQQTPQVPLRIGIHTGDISYDETGAYGDGVNVTSRIERLCLPGAVYLTAKVYDDIKNHPWLKAKNLGDFHLRNIIEDVTVYAISSKGLRLPEPEDLDVDLSLPKQNREEAEDLEHVHAHVGQRKKLTAAFLAFFLGIFGTHKFYLGQRGKGIAYLVLFFVTMLITIEEGVPAIGILGIIAFVESILLLVMPKAEFDQKYNGGKTIRGVKSRKKKKPKRIRSQRRDNSLTSRMKKVHDSGVKKYSARRFDDAIDDFDAVLEWDSSNNEAHFYLAKCFSMVGDKDEAFHHLSLAVNYGFRNFNLITTDPAFIYLRAQPIYQRFIDNNYKIPLELPAPKKDLLETDRFDPSILDKIESLGDKLETGELDLKEFQLLKKKILRGE